MAGDHSNIYPTLVIGLGGTGTNVVRLVKRRFLRAWNTKSSERREWLNERGLPTIGAAEARDLPGLLQIMAVDTEPLVNKPLEEPLYFNEFAFMGRFDATRLINHKREHPWLYWWKWDAKTDITPGYIHSGARQLRPIGRLAFFRNYLTYQKMLTDKLTDMRKYRGEEEVEENQINVETNAQCVVFIVSSVCGGTGAGMFIDAAHVARHYAAEKFGGKAEVRVVGIFFMPSVFESEVQGAIQRRRIRANAYAALKELNHFHTSQDFRAWYPGENRAIPTEPYRAFSQIFIVELDDKYGQALSKKQAAEQMAAHLIHMMTFSSVNTKLFSLDSNVTEEHKLAYSSFGMSAMVVPQDALWRYFVARTTGWLLSNFFLEKGDPAKLRDLHRDFINLLLKKFGEYAVDVKTLDALSNDIKKGQGRWVEFDQLFQTTIQRALGALRDTGLYGIYVFLEQLLKKAELAQPGMLAHPDTLPITVGKKPSVNPFSKVLGRTEDEVETDDTSFKTYNLQKKTREVWEADIVPNIQRLASGWLTVVNGVRAAANDNIRRVTTETQRLALEVNPLKPNHDPETSTFYDLETGAVSLSHLPLLAERAQALLDENIRSLLLLAVYEQLHQQANPNLLVRPSVNFIQVVEQALEHIPGLRQKVYSEFDLRSIVELQRRQEGRPTNDRISQLFQRVAPHATVDGDRHDHQEGVQEPIRIVSIPTRRNGKSTAADQDGSGTEEIDDALLEALRDYRQYDQVLDNEGERIDVMHIAHGMPVGDLSSMSDLYAHYIGQVDPPPGQTLAAAQANRAFTQRLLHLDISYVGLPEIYDDGLTSHPATPGPNGNGNPHTAPEAEAQTPGAMPPGGPTNPAQNTPPGTPYARPAGSDGGPDQHGPAQPRHNP